MRACSLRSKTNTLLPASAVRVRTDGTLVFFGKPATRR